MTMEPTCAPSSFGASTSKERDACVVPLSRRDCVKFFLSTLTMDSSTPVAARPVRNRANKTPVTTRSANADARRISLLAGPPARDVWTIASTTLGTLDVLHPNWSLGIQVRRNGCVIRIPAIPPLSQSHSLSQKLPLEYSRIVGRWWFRYVLSGLIGLVLSGKYPNSRTR